MVIAFLTAMSGALCGLLLGYPSTAHIAAAAPLTLLPLLYAYRYKGRVTCAALTVLFVAAQLLVGMHWAYAGAASNRGAGDYVVSVAALLFECVPYALMGFVAPWLSRLRPAPWCIAVASIWTVCEYWRATSPLGFPYLQLGHALIDTPLIGVARIGGTEALTFLCVFGATALFELSRRTARVRIASVLACAVALALNAAVPAAQTKPAHQGFPVVVFQLGPLVKTTLPRYVDALQTLPAKYGLAIWPESALDLPFRPTLTEIQSAVRARGVPLLAGGAVADTGGVHDALVVFDRDGNIGGYYAKRHLIPLGEYVPPIAHALIPAPLLAEIPNLSGGTSPVTFSVSKRLLGPLICFESAYPALARDEVRQGATLLVAASDDTWFMQPSGIWQVAQTARLVAYETGTPMVVAGTVGPSGIIDADGRWTDTVAVGVNVTAALRVGPARVTLYDSAGDAPALAAICALGLLAVLWVDGYGYARRTAVIVRE